MAALRQMMQVVCEKFRLVTVLLAGRELYNRVARSIFIVTDIRIRTGLDAAAQLHAELCFGGYRS